MIKRRSKLLRKLGEQRELALAQSEGRTYAPKRLRTLRDKESSLQNSFQASAQR